MLASSQVPGESVSQQEIDAVRTLLTSKPRPVGWSERRQRIDEIGATWPVADDVRLEEVDLDGVPGEWSIVPGSNPSHVCCSFMAAAIARVRSSAIVDGDRAGRAARMRTLAVNYRRRPSILIPRHMRTR